MTGKFERNTDIGLELRVVGRRRVRAATSCRPTVRSSGLPRAWCVTREIPVDGETSNNMEVFVGASYSFFTYDRPKTNIDVRRSRCFRA